MQVNALVAHHVVPLSRIDIEVGLCSGGDAGFEETVGMLWHYSWIIKTDNNL